MEVDDPQVADSNLPEEMSTEKAPQMTEAELENLLKDPALSVNAQ